MDIPERQLLVLLLLVLVLHLPALFTYKGYVHDEVYFAEFSKNLAYGNGTIFDVHPYLQKDITAASILLFGNNPLGWRLPNMIAHIFLVLAVFFVAREIFPKKRAPARQKGFLLPATKLLPKRAITLAGHQKRPTAPLLAALLMAAETMTFTLGSFAMIDIWAPLFLTLAFLFILRFLSSEKGKERPLFLSALFAGLALASKWPAAVVLAVFFVYLVHEGRLFQRKRLLASFLIVSAVVYSASFLPMAAQGQDPVLWHTQALNYHLTLNATHPYFSHPATWPVSLRPVWFEFASQDSWVKGVFAAGNIFILWPMAPAAVYVLLKRRKEKHLLLLALTFLIFWLSFFPLRTTSMYNLAPVIPFGVLLVAGLLSSVRKRWVVAGYAAAAIAFFLFFYPLLVGLPIPEWFYQLHIWLPGWI